MFNSVSDLILQGPGPSSRDYGQATHRPELNGSRALCIDSTPYDKLCPPGKIHPGCRDGATYYNTVSGLTIAVRRLALARHTLPARHQALLPLLSLGSSRVLR